MAFSQLQYMALIYLLLAGIRKTFLAFLWIRF